MALNGVRLEVVLMIILLLGRRPGEVLGLRWHDVDFGATQLPVEHSLKREATGLLARTDQDTTVASGGRLPRPCRHRAAAPGDPCPPERRPAGSPGRRALERLEIASARRRCPQRAVHLAVDTPPDRDGPPVQKGLPVALA